ncbi:MAG: hypothetical protein K2O47_08320, partial [Muribaculaceae bacterium]|nr:hypothetical protein [Muribaculaceae bacterium]
MAVWSSLPAHANIMTETITLSFDENDFNLHENENGEIEIDSKLNVIYPEANEPGIPVISRDIVVDGNYDYNSASLSIERREIMSNVRIAPTPMLITTDTPINSIQIETNSYTSDRQYPSSNCRYIATSNWDNLNVLHFLTTPFIYNAIEEKLYFIDSIRLDIKLSKQPKVSGRPSNKISYDILKSFVYNSAKVDELTASLPNMQSIDLEDRIDYVVITNKELAPSFKPLCQWKTEKGLYSKIITIEEIKSNYEGKDIQLKIKNCLYDLYINHGLKYVLLGGDNSIVPSRGCYGAVKTDRGIIKDLTIPTDMYYACFDGTFDWDDDNNGIYGEIADNIDLKQSLFVTRLPIYTSDDVNSYVNKLFDYEKHPTFDNNLLMCGVKFQRIESTMKSDTEMKGENFYKKYIKPYWNGIRQRLYDT